MGNVQFQQQFWGFHWVRKTWKMCSFWQWKAKEFGKIPKPKTPNCFGLWPKSFQFLIARNQTFFSFCLFNENLQTSAGKKMKALLLVLLSPIFSRRNRNNFWLYPSPPWMVSMSVGLGWRACELPLCVNLSCSIFFWLSSSSTGCLPVAGCLWAGLSIPCKIIWTFSFQKCRQHPEDGKHTVE